MTRLPILLALAACAPQEREIRQPTPELSAIVDGHNRFALDILKTAGEADKSMTASPFSISSALGMTWMGARGETATEMADVLGIDVDPDTYAREFGALVRDLDGDHRRSYTLNIANGLWGLEGMSFKGAFVDSLSEHFGAPLEAVDFFSKAESIRADINRWVSKRTKGYIDELLGEGVVTSNTVLMLVNAIYFEADWAESFEVESTRLVDFAATDGTRSVQMMGQLEQFQHGDFAQADVLRLPYEGEEVAMYVVLPDAGVELADLTASLSVETLEGWFAELQPTQVSVELPRFEVRQKLELIGVLEELGMSLPFDGTLADLSGIAEGDLFIGSAGHEAVVKVDEQGTVAAAATFVGVEAVSEPPPPIDFHADRPFLFFLRDDLTGSLLFVGRISDSSALDAG